MFAIMEEKRSRSGNSGRKGKSRKKLYITLSVIVLLLAGIGAGGYLYLQNLRHNTAAYFSSAPTATPAPTQSAPASAAPETTVSAAPSEYDALKAQADTSMMQNIVNVLLVGVDYAEERLTEEWLEEGGSTAEHADVMIVLAINFDEKTVDMISLPRDTYAKIPGVTGIYKLNASLDCGGGLFLKDENGQWIADANGKYQVNEAGFAKVCEAAPGCWGTFPSTTIMP